MSSADWLGRQTSFAGACTRLHDALAAAGAKAAMEVDYPLDRRPEVRITLAHDEVLVMAEILERYSAWAKPWHTTAGRYVVLDGNSGNVVASAATRPEVERLWRDLPEEVRSRSYFKWVAPAE